jgi:hypothetical protein
MGGIGLWLRRSRVRAPSVTLLFPHRKAEKAGAAATCEVGEGPPYTTTHARPARRTSFCCRGIDLLTIRYIHLPTLHVAPVRARGGLRRGS